MSTEQILALLLAERDRIERAITALGGAKGAVGRPAGTTSPRRARTPEQRQAQSEKMKQYWASRKLEAAGKKAKRKAA
jgi:hypothetical protein